MALRVLLADESTTIKKVMQLALQDFAVEVKAVHVGVDVIEVARAFKPDIIFVDVLLQKKNGYEVALDLKNEATTHLTPVVLMWSSFMDLDKAQVAKAKVEGKLEKPFDVETLRKLVLNLVPATRTQRLAHFLEFSDKVTDPLHREISAQSSPPPIEASRAEAAPEPPPLQRSAPPPPPPVPQSAQAKGAPPPPINFTPPRNIPEPPPIVPPIAPLAPPIAPQTAPAAPASQPSWNMESFEDVNDFASRETESAGGDLSLEPEDQFAPMSFAKTGPSMSVAPEGKPAADDDEPWAHQDLSRFRIELPPVSVQSDELDLTLDTGAEEFTRAGYVADFGGDALAEPPANPNFALENTAAPNENDFARPDQSPRELEASPEELEMGTPLTLDDDLTETMTPLAPQAPSAPRMEAPQMDLRQTTLGANPGKVDADGLEKIIRAQSREIIEEVVRRIVPDLASQIIREELERLLEDTAIRENRL